MIVDDIATVLISSGFGTAIGTDIWPTKHLPKGPANLVAIILLGTGKEPDYFSAASGLGALDYPGFQIQVRNTDYEVGWDKAEDIRQALDGATISGCVICMTTRSQPENVTSEEDLKVTGGPVFRFACDFTITKVRT